MLRILCATAPGALVWGALGLVLVFSLSPDPVGYIGAGCMVLAVCRHHCDRPLTPTTVAVGVIAIVPLALLALALWMLANDPS
jgi:hypothetical protein